MNRFYSSVVIVLVGVVIYLWGCGEEKSPSDVQEYTLTISWSSPDSQLPETVDVTLNDTVQGFDYTEGQARISHLMAGSYRIELAGKNAQGVVTHRSQEKTVELGSGGSQEEDFTLTAEYPDRPSNVQVSVDYEDKMLISWDSTGSLASSFDVYRKSDDQDKFYFVDSTPNQTYEDRMRDHPELEKAQWYTYQIRAVSDGGIVSSFSTGVKGYIKGWRFSDVRYQTKTVCHIGIGCVVNRGLEYKVHVLGYEGDGKLLAMYVWEMVGPSLNYYEVDGDTAGCSTIQADSKYYRAFSEILTPVAEEYDSDLQYTGFFPGCFPEDAENRVLYLALKVFDDTEFYSWEQAYLAYDEGVRIQW